MRSMTNRILAATTLLAAGSVTGFADCRNRFALGATGAGTALDMSGYVETRQQGSRQRLKLSLDARVADGTVLPVWVDGAAAGTVTVRLGSGELELKNFDGKVLPPTITSVCTVQQVAVINGNGAILLYGAPGASGVIAASVSNSNSGSGGKDDSSGSGSNRQEDRQQDRQEDRQQDRQQDRQEDRQQDRQQGPDDRNSGSGSSNSAVETLVKRSLVATGQGQAIDASGYAEVRVRGARQRFKVQVEAAVRDGSIFLIQANGRFAGSLVVTLGRGELELDTERDDLPAGISSFNSITNVTVLNATGSVVLQTNL